MLAGRWLIGLCAALIRKIWLASCQVRDVGDAYQFLVKLTVGLSCFMALTSRRMILETSMSAQLDRPHEAVGVCL